MLKTNHIGLRIKKARIESGVSQLQLAEALNINQSNVSRMENGTQEPSISQLRILKLILKVDYDYLIDGKRYEKTSEKSENLGDKWKNLKL